MRRRSVKECSECGQRTRHWVLSGNVAVCRDCDGTYDDRLAHGFEMLGASDDSIECERHDDDDNEDGWQKLA